jgi:diaminopimelate epimerase
MKNTILHFDKMQGLGNDFVVFDNREGVVSDLPVLAKFVCDRHFGVGADGLIALENSNKADFKMVYLNADGSRSVCGNGMRCLARFIKEHGFVPDEQKEIVLETDHNLIFTKLDKEFQAISVDMGEPILEGKDIPVAGEGRQVKKTLEVDGKEFSFTAVSMGNPHCVIFVDDLNSIALNEIGPKIETHSYFPKKTNVHFVKVKDSHNVEILTWERGVGQTLACATGFSAIIVACVLEERTTREINLTARGGDCALTWSESDNRVRLIGPAEKVYEGILDLAKIL